MKLLTILFLLAVIIGTAAGYAQAKVYRINHVVKTK